MTGHPRSEHVLPQLLSTAAGALLPTGMFSHIVVVPEGAAVAESAIKSAGLTVIPVSSVVDDSWVCVGVGVTSVAGATVVGASVVGAAVVGASVAGLTVVGASVTGAAIDGASVAGATVVGSVVSAGVSRTVVGLPCSLGSTSAEAASVGKLVELDVRRVVLRVVRRVVMSGTKAGRSSYFFDQHLHLPLLFVFLIVRPWSSHPPPAWILDNRGTDKKRPETQPPGNFNPMMAGT